MRAVEINAEYFGISLLQLMETAGRNVAEEIIARFNPKETRVAIFCGSGGNGGDGFVAARHLLCLGFKVEIILANAVGEYLEQIPAGVRIIDLKASRPLTAVITSSPS